MRFLEALSDAILDRSPEELTGAMLIAAAVAVVTAALYALGRRKASPSPTFVGGLALAAGASCMALAAGYLKYAETESSAESAETLATLARSARWPTGAPGPGMPGPAWNLPGAGWSSGFHTVVAADENRDGRLTTEEAAQLVRKADTDGDGAVDFRDIDRLILSRFRPPFTSPASAASTKNGLGDLDGPPDSRVEPPPSPYRGGEGS